MADMTDKKTILLVDDDETHLLIAQSLLKHDYKTLTAKSGEEALGYYAKGIYPDMVLLDIFMPSMDGWETYHRLKGISVLKEIPIAFLTSENDAMEEKHAYEIGAADYIIKPYDKANLLQRVQRVLDSVENSADSDN